MIRPRFRWMILLLLAAFPALANDPSPEALMESGHWKRVRAIAEPRVRANPNDAQAAYLLSRARLAFGKTDEALKLAEKAVALDGNNSSYHLQLARVTGLMARSAGLFGGWSLASRFRKETEAAISLDPKNVDAKFALMEFSLQAPAIAGGDKDRARALAEEILRLDPARGYLAQARIAEAEKETAKLEGLYGKAVEANPASYPAELALAGFYSSDAQGKYDLAEKHARAAMKLDPGRAGAYAALAGAFAHQQRWQDLEALLSQAEKNIPDNLYPYYAAGRVLLLEGKDLPRAERYLRKYLTQEAEGNTPTQAHAHWRLGLVLEKQGRKQDAITELETAVRIKPDLEDAQKDLNRLK